MVVKSLLIVVSVYQIEETERWWVIFSCLNLNKIPGLEPTGFYKLTKFLLPFLTPGIANKNTTFFISFFRRNLLKGPQFI